MRHIEKSLSIRRLNIKRLVHPFVLLLSILIMTIPAYAASPWENAVEQLRIAFTGPIARKLSLVSIVLGGIDVCFW
jgi:type IV secretory pathway VirB2 component (pilin)